MKIASPIVRWSVSGPYQVCTIETQEVIYSMCICETKKVKSTPPKLLKYSHLRQANKHMQQPTQTIYIQVYTSITAIMYLDKFHWSCY